MKNLNRIAAALALSLFGFAAHAAPIITFNSADASDGSGLTTPVAGATVIDFNDDSLLNTRGPAGFFGQGGVVKGSSSGAYAAPAGNTTQYLSVALGQRAGSHTITFDTGVTYNYFGLYWGSIDDYNTLSFFNGATEVLTLTGAQVIANPNFFGNQTADPANRYVNIFLGATSYDKIVISTTQFAFESDNHAFAQVPEPGTLALLGLGLIGAGALRRRRSQ
ncbi:PEP-CTERM sorting domain-containing protein [Wenzhouxiangella sp. XN24]|uniref:Npun_F0296 family exosortase-dependent surface protein n=1 Tax=Wenzhouxiangella sp. XN24 TaxID=2713569 RepID=UPI0013EC1B22|nr:PEP-CTERM sorting domain-containing protein [Wenzhouxiangella sp. XN24]NGX16849.1 PEP-CTERM sorting domain-containing protein [Wenzhouxiangella sp. XN24]